MDKKSTLLKLIREQGVLPLFYYSSGTVSVEVVRVLYKAGIRVLEYTNRGPVALENFKLLKQTFAQEAPDLVLGIGTIKTADEAKTFIDAGADFIVSPVMNPEVAEIANKAGLLWVPGCMTPTEIHTAQQFDASLIKIFPANILGPAFVSTIKELFPGQLFIPTGGVELNRDNILTWYKSGVCAVGMGSKLISNAILKDQLYDELYEKTKEALNLIKEVRESMAAPAAH